MKVGCILRRMLRLAAHLRKLESLWESLSRHGMKRRVRAMALGNSRIQEKEVAGEYHHLGDPSKKVFLRAGGNMHSSENGKPSEDEKGTWSVRNSEIHVSVAGDNFVFEINGDGNLQVVALLNNGFREDAPESIKKGFILKRNDAEKVESEEYDEGDDELSFPLLVLVWFIKIVIVWPIYWPCWLVWKIVYVALLVGLVFFVVGAVLDNQSLSNVGAWAVCGVGPLGLMLRLYVWALNLRFGDGEPPSKRWWW